MYIRILTNLNYSKSTSTWCILECQVNIAVLYKAKNHKLQQFHKHFLFPSSQITEMQNNNYMSVIPANATKTHHSVSMLSVTSKLSPLVPLGLNKALFSVLSNGSCVRSRTNTPAAKPPILIPRVLDLCQYLDTFIRVWKKRHIVEPVW